jgi:hypothetical protein
MSAYPKAINDPALDAESRLEALKGWEATRQRPDAGTVGGEVNNHIHTIYSFSPYTPSMAALLGSEAGLCAAGSVDHDSAAAATEMRAACAILGIGGCTGFEVRVSFKNGPFAQRKINNPDSEGYAYMTVQGIPSQSLPKVAAFLAPIRQRRLERTRSMCDAVNAKLGVGIDFENDIVRASKYHEDGGITERHLLAALAHKLTQRHGKGPDTASGIAKTLGIAIAPKTAALLGEKENPHYLYDLLGVLKSEFLPRIYIQPDENECLPAESVTAFASSIGAIPAYAYLGDVAESPTGDKKAEKFEDDYIEALFAELSRLGYRAVTYMPPRNTPTQLRTIRRLSAQWGFMEISGVDINSSRQSFNCPQVLQKEFCHLLDTTWALVAHEWLSSVDARYGLFSYFNPLAGSPLLDRVALYAKSGKQMNLRRPDESAQELIAHIDAGNIPG